MAWLLSVGQGRSGNGRILLELRWARASAPIGCNPQAFGRVKDLFREWSPKSITKLDALNPDVPSHQAFIVAKLDALNSDVLSCQTLIYRACRVDGTPLSRSGAGSRRTIPFQCLRQALHLPIQSRQCWGTRVGFADGSHHGMDS